MKNLFDFSKEVLFEKEGSKNFKFKSINESLLNLELGKEYGRDELRILISNERMLSKYGEDGILKMNEKEKKDIWFKISVSVKNGLDSSISESNNNSSFNFNSRNDGICKGFELCKSGSSSVISINKIKK